MNRSCMCLRERHIYLVTIYSFLIVSLLALYPNTILSLEKFPRKIAFTSHHESERSLCPCTDIEQINQLLLLGL